MKNCGACGGENVETNKFCTGCGESFETRIKRSISNFFKSNVETTTNEYDNSDIYGDSLYSSDIYDNDVNRILNKLLKSYNKKSFDRVFSGEVLTEGEETCYYIRREEEFELDLPSIDKVREILNEDIKLIRGIGDIKKKKLESEGFCTIEALQLKSNYCEIAREMNQTIISGSYEDLIDIIPNKYSASHPFYLFFSTFFDKKNFVVIDIESLGLRGVPIFLIGVGEFTENDTIIVHLYFARNVEEEYLMLKKTLDHINSDSIILSFNGKSFDLPFIEQRLAYNGIKGKIRHLPHIDLRYFSAREWKNDLVNCKLGTIEREIFGIDRKEDVPSQYVPAFYHRYLKEENIGPIVPIINHNYQDIVSLGMILCELASIWIDEYMEERE